MYYTIYKDGTGGWRWRFLAANNEIVASGESYINKADCLYAISLLKGSSNAPVYER
jgi:uncharacterized protein YegP (UPF0339 family)